MRTPRFIHVHAIAIRLLIVLLMTFPFATIRAQSEQARITGRVVDEAGGAVPGVTITATHAATEGDPVLAFTDMSGEFQIGGLAPGVWRLEAVLDGFQPVVREIDLSQIGSRSLQIVLVPAFGETVEVVGEAQPVGEVESLESRRQAAVVSDSISAEEISKTPDSTAAGVVERLTGVSVVGEKYVYVRGLGERYSSTTLNGSTVPTTEPEKRVVPLDLFPAKLLEKVNVVKTHTPDMPGDFGSGVVELTTTAFPESATLKISVGAGYQSAATGSDFRRYAGGVDRLGNGGQPIASSLPSVRLTRRSALDPAGFTPAELERFGEALVGSWGGTVETADPATDFSLMFGRTIGRLGIVLSAVSTHGYETVEEEQRFFGLDSDGQLVPRNDYDMLGDRETARLGFVGNLNYRLGEGQKLYLNSIFTRDASSEFRFQEGLNTNTGGHIRDYRGRYGVEEVLGSRFGGEHSLAASGLLDWHVGWSLATNDSDLRENLYRESGPGEYALQIGFPESGRMDFFALEDEVREAGASYTRFLTAATGDWYGSIKGGLSYIDRTRDFEARRLRFTTANQLQFDLTLDPEDIFTPENIRPGGLELREITGVNDAYDATQDVSAAYLMGDLTVGKWRVIGGGRYERSEQLVSTFNPFDTQAAVTSEIASTDVLPSLNLVYEYAPGGNLRFGYGQSVNRPEFRELSPFTFVEVTGGRSLAGNPELQQATITSYDIRWELFPRAGEVVAASVFHKTIDDPIERIIQPTTELRTSFVNADTATLWGLELEFRRSLVAIAPSLERWTVNANWAWIESDVEVGEQQLSVVTSLERPLEGQADQTANLALEYLHPGWGSRLRLLGAYGGTRLTDVGAFGLPDIYEEAFTSVDLTYSQPLDRFANGVELKVSGSNLLDAERKFTQGDEIQRRYEPGRTFSVGLSYSPF